MTWRSSDQGFDVVQDLEQRRFARPVAPDDAHHLAPFHLERDVLQGPGDVIGFRIWELGLGRAKFAIRDPKSEIESRRVL